MGSLCIFQWAHDWPGLSSHRVIRWSLLLFSSYSSVFLLVIMVRHNLSWVPGIHIRSYWSSAMLYASRQREAHVFHLLEKAYEDEVTWSSSSTIVEYARLRMIVVGRWNWIATFLVGIPFREIYNYSYFVDTSFLCKVSTTRRGVMATLVESYRFRNPRKYLCFTQPRSTSDFSLDFNAWWILNE